MKRLMLTAALLACTPLAAEAQTLASKITHYNLAMTRSLNAVHDGAGTIVDVTSCPGATSCQLAVIKVLTAEPVAISSSDTVSTGRTPKRSMSAAANGAVSPYNIMLTDIASPTVPCDQPNS